MTSRRFPPPWTIIEHAESYWVQDATGQGVGWFYFRHDPEVARHAGVLSRDEARRMAVNFARLPELLGNQPTAWPVASWAKTKRAGPKGRPSRTTSRSTCFEPPS